MISAIRKNYKYFIIFFGVLTLVMSVIRIYIVKSSEMINARISEETEETVMQYKVPDNGYTKAYMCTIVAIVILFFIFAFLTSKDASPNKDLLSVSFFQVFFGVILLSSFLYYIGYNVICHKGYKRLFIIYCVIAALSCVYYLLSALYHGAMRKKVLEWLSMIPSFALMVRLVYTFFETNNYQSFSSYQYLMTGLSLLLIVFITEAKLQMDIRSARPYVFFALSAILFVMVYSIPNLFLSLFHDLPLNEFTLLSGVDIIAAVYTFVILLSMNESKALTPDQEDE